MLVQQFSQKEISQHYYTNSGFVNIILLPHLIQIILPLGYYQDISCSHTFYEWFAVLQLLC